MNIGLDLNVFCLRDEDLKNDDIGLEVDLDNCVLREFTFYDIAYISKHKDNPDYTLVGSNGDEFIVNEKHEVVKNKIEQLRILKFN